MAAALTLDADSNPFGDGDGTVKRDAPRAGRRGRMEAQAEEALAAPGGGAVGWGDDSAPPPPPRNDGGFMDPEGGGEGNDEGGAIGGAPPPQQGESSPPPPASKAGWGNDGDPGQDLFAGLGEDKEPKHTGVSRRKQQQQDAEPYEYDEDLRKGPDRRKHMHDDEGADGIMEIPELDAEGEEEDITRQVAAPPRARNNRVQTIKELDHDMQYNIPSNADKEIDLSLLTACLVPSERILEDEDVWEAEALLQSVSQELTSEAEALEENGDKPEVPERPPNLNPDDKFYTENPNK
mmetsp:Transcript_63277/g.200143  ORF Transcript_63277/g.200143 Transcript_63277/m.200143 type:complete len:293 (-) Transcript_63277:43-921(-)|eukprot:CAMPEP_0182855706 /NCGR_PEP_ID=MMETSP0034_2-20130328/2007_1 /TAXON_ID=156128 /ORGANISM="Nephroselmis pyriformis, Strain CCMP717" /LENGTH=292 /DNA_ID=CAMNT_0024986711 /DNA_START=101 /DNA_END=979 /DNA_ORIENTATION=+